MKKMILAWKGVLATLTVMTALVVGLIASYEKAPPADLAIGAIAGNPFEGPIAYSPKATTTVKNAQTAITLSSGELENFGVFNLLHGDTLTITLPATSTFGTFVRYPNQKVELTFNNLSANTDVIFTEGTGWDLEAAATSTAGRRIGPLDSARLVVQRHGTTTDVKAFLTVFDD